MKPATIGLLNKLVYGIYILYIGLHSVNIFRSFFAWYFISLLQFFLVDPFRFDNFLLSHSSCFFLHPRISVFLFFFLQVDTIPKLFEVYAMGQVMFAGYSSIELSENFQTIYYILN